jgi:cardiolipin synthase
MRRQLTLLVNGQQYFARLVEDIEQARAQIYVETYLLSLDPETEPVFTALERAARRGVRVMMVIDGFGGRLGLPLLQARWQACGIEWRVFRPGVRLFSPESWRRLHRKLVLIDQQILYLGGINLIGDHVDIHHGPLPDPRFDLAVRTQWPSVCSQVLRLAQSTWWRLSWSTVLRAHSQGQQLRDLWRGLRPALRRRWQPPLSGDRRQVRLLLRDNLRHRHSIERAYRRELRLARGDVMMAMAYFLPTRGLRGALLQAARSGVRVRLLIQGRVEYWWAHWAQQALVSELVDEGIEIYEYRKSFLHAKVLCVDDWVTIGSSNIDPFSLMLSLEANLAIEQPLFAKQVRAALEQAIDQGAERLLSPTLRYRGARGSILRWAHQMAMAAALLGLRMFIAMSRRAHANG